MSILLSCLPAVSYTHLDVYKRQIYALRGLIGALAIELGAASYDARKFAEIDANLAASAVAVAADDIKG